MTIVAAFRAQGIPVLIGDMLITSLADNKESNFLPTQPYFSKSLPHETGRRVCGARKKVHLINDKLVIGWAGSLHAASRVLAKLNNLFASEKATRETLEKALTSINDYTEEIWNVHVIGWIFDGEPHCFRWNSGYPSEVFFHHSHFEGSGENTFLETFTAHTNLYAGPGVDSPELVAQMGCLAMISKLIDKEIWTGVTLKESFGYCYEVIYLDGDEFRFVDEVAYPMWEIKKERAGYWYRAGPLIVKYKNVGKFSVVQTSHLYGELANSTHLDMVTPVFDEMKTFDVAKLGRQSLASDYYCNFMRFEYKDGNVFTGPLVVHSSSVELMCHEQKDGKDSFSLNMKKIAEAFGLK